MTIWLAVDLLCLGDTVGFPTKEQAFQCVSQWARESMDEENAAAEIEEIRLTKRGEWYRIIEIEYQD